MRPPLPAFVVALLLGLACAGLVACGEEDQGLISAARADRMREDLDRIDEQVAEGRCDAVDGRLASLRREVENMPRGTDRELRRRLADGVRRLEQQAPRDCEAQKTTETQPETTPTETTPTETVPEETVPEETVPEETVPEETVPEETVPEETVPQDTSGTGGGTGDDGGGNGGSGTGNQGNGDGGGGDGAITGQGGTGGGSGGTAAP